MIRQSAPTGVTPIVSEKKTSWVEKEECCQRCGQWDRCTVVVVDTGAKGIHGVSVHLLMCFDCNLEHLRSIDPDARLEIDYR